MQVQLSEIPKVMVKMVEQAGQQVADEKVGEVEVVEVLRREGSMLEWEALLLAELTTV
jgi:hypothetical protein